MGVRFSPGAQRFFKIIFFYKMGEEKIIQFPISEDHPNNSNEESAKQQEKSFKLQLRAKIEELGGRYQEVRDSDILAFYITEAQVEEIESFLGQNGYARENSEKSFFGDEDMGVFAQPGKYKCFKTAEGDFMFRVTKKSNSK